RVADGSYRDALTPKIRNLRGVRSANQIPGHLFRLKHDGFDGSAANRRAHAASSGAAILDVGAHECRNRGGSWNDDSLILEALAAKKSLHLSNRKREIIHCEARNCGSHALGCGRADE